VTKQKSPGHRGLKWKIAAVAWACAAAFISGGAPAFGRSLSEGDGPLLPFSLQPSPSFSAKFSLSPLSTSHAGVKEIGSRPLTFSSQQQPFVEPRVRLRDDDPEYTKKSSVWSAAFRVVSANVLIWAVDRFVFNYDYSHIGPTTWKHNLQSGWEWDTDRLGMNFFFHPLTGGWYFNAARANGYSFLESVPFSFLGSLMWENFGETTRPSYNDLINTTLSGALFGEIFFRLSSNLLDDRTTGTERFFREFGAFILDPGRGLNRLFTGKMGRVTSKEIYQKELLNVAIYVGTHWFNKGASFGTGSTSGILNIQLDYGDPFEVRDRKPFDFFKLRIDLSYGANVGAKYVDNVTGYGLLFGKTIHAGDWDILFGAFQHYNYWDSRVFELSVLGFGGGIVAKWQFSKTSNFQTAFHLGIVPLGATNSPNVDIVDAGIHGRNYDYDNGIEAKFEGTLNLGEMVQLTVIDYLYGLHVMVGPGGTKLINIFKPRIALRLFGGLRLGFEYLYFHKDAYIINYPDVHAGNSEQKLYLMLYF
jgi:hypothetical protein